MPVCRVCYVIKMVTRGHDAPVYEVERAYTGADCYHNAINQARKLNERNEGTWLHYFASQYLPEDFPA